MRRPVLLQSWAVAASLLLLLVLLTPSAVNARALRQSGFAAEVLSKINAIRSSKGLPALQYSQSMDAAAARHSYDMSGKRALSHTGSDGSQFSDRLRVAGGGGFKCSGENVAETGSGGSADGVVGMWMGSQGHRDNMMRTDYTHVGVGRATNGGRVFWTLVLGGCNL